MAVALVSSVVVGIPAKAHAQSTFEAVGTRPLGMAGAFVALADDPSAVHWNPSGLAGGPLAGLTIGWHDFQVGKRGTESDGPTGRARTTMAALSTWPLGLSYNTLDRQIVHRLPNGQLDASRVRLRQAGATVLHTLSDNLVAGATVRLIRAETAALRLPDGVPDAALDAVSLVKTHGKWAGDVDVALTGTSGRVRAAVVVRNLRSLDVGAAPGSRGRLPRQARLGVAIGPLHGLTLAIDTDVNTVAFLGDLRRMSALGAEISLGSRLLVRSGVRWNLADSSGPSGAVGASVRVRRALWLEAHAARGEASGARELSVALRASL